jgi:hypothetical protein
MSQNMYRLRGEVWAREQTEHQTFAAASIEAYDFPRFSHRAALVSCYGDAEIPLLRPGVSCLSSSPAPPIVRPQPALQAGGRG